MTIHHTPRILIVDDEPDIALILKLHLEDAGYWTVCARDGQQGLDILAEGGIDLVLLDFRMPLMGGVEVLTRIRESGIDVAVIMMTAHGSENLAVECMKSGALDYFPKPFTLDDMLPRVERALAYRRAVHEKQRLEQEKADFVSMLSHDLKNPITAVVGSIDIVREGRLGQVNQEQVEYLQAAIDSCEEVVAMIDNLLDIHRFEAGKMQMNIRTHNPADIVTSVTAKFARVAEHEQIRMSLELGDELPQIAVDRIALTRIIANLLTNAIKFTPEEGEIFVSCRRTRDLDAQRSVIPSYAVIPDGFDAERCLIRLSVRDTGHGIPSDELGNIFERFVQVHGTGVRERGGAGLGLAYCKMAVEGMGGVIWAESDLGAGSEFCPPSSLQVLGRGLLRMTRERWRIRRFIFSLLAVLAIAVGLCRAHPVSATEIDFTKALVIGSGPQKVVEFTDPDCPYCRQASWYLDGRKDVTRYVFFLPLARHPDAREKARHILSRTDSAAAYHEVMSGQLDDRKKWNTTVQGIKLQEEQLKIAKSHGITSTPTFMISGRIIEGFDLKRIKEALGSK